MFAAPAAVCDHTGLVRACNRAFARWAGAGAGGRISIHGARGALPNGDGPAYPLVLSPIASGDWLALPSPGDSPSAVAAVANTLASRLAQLQQSLAVNAAAGLLEGPSPPVADCLREALATADELLLVQRQVAALGTAPSGGRAPTCVRVLLLDAISALPRIPVLLQHAEGDFTAEVDSTRLFPLLVSLLSDLTEDHTRESPLLADVRGGDCVRLSFRSPRMPSAPTPGTDTMRRFVHELGGRMLLEPGEALTIEIPSFTRGLGAGGGQGTVLIVDDDASLLAMMSAVLRRAGFRVLSAENGVTASTLWRKHKPEIVAIVADAVLPGRSGVELACEARRSVPHLPVLLVSGHSSDLLGGTAQNDLPILSKPFGARVLADRVRQILAPPVP